MGCLFVATGMVNKWLIINTLHNTNVVTRTLKDIHIDTETINTGNLSVTARCHIGDNMDSLLMKCYIYSDATREKIYGSMYYKEELAIYTPSGGVEYVDVTLSHWVEGIALSEYISKPNSNFKVLSHNFDAMAYSLLLDNVIHCDIKPDNIIVNHDGQMTLIDYDALWSETWDMGPQCELGTEGYRDLKRGAYTPPILSRDYPIVLISIMLASLSLEYDTIYPYIKHDTLLNPCDEHRFLAAISCAKEIFQRAGDETHIALCHIITPDGVDSSHLVDLMYNAAYMHSRYDWKSGVSRYFDI